LKRARLQEKVDTFQKQAANILQAVDDDEEDSWGDASVREFYTGMEFDGIGEEYEDGTPAEKDPDGTPAEEDTNGSPAEEDIDGPPADVDAEYIPLHLPSHLGGNWCKENAAEDLLKMELRLREGQLNDALHHIRIALGHKSYLFRNDIRPARTQRLKTRAWAEVHAVEATVQHHARVYMHARKAIVNLRADSDLLCQYKVLTRQDLSVKTSVISADVRGQWNKSLPWFWTLDVRRDADIGAWMEDCMCSIIYARQETYSLTLTTVYRVHWLRAKAQKMRWIEELQCLQVEMESAIRFFRHQEQFWRTKHGLTDHQSLPGHAAWAARQSALWHWMGAYAESKFTALIESDPPPNFAKVLWPP